jgi:predicted nucleic acid-binding protein
VCEELTRTLLEKVHVPEATVRDIAAFIRASASFPATASDPPPVTIRDPDDAVILSEALALRADGLVTGDEDLLEAGEVAGIRILAPRGFWQLVRRKAT